jgi:hypothetical protein
MRRFELEDFKKKWRNVKLWLYWIIYKEYWKRLWVIQEICLATKLSVHFGDGQIPWNTFVGLVALYKEIHSNDHRADTIVNLAATRSDLYRGGEAYSLSALLTTYKNAFCQDPRDKIYGFLGMASDHIGQIILVDYKKPLPEVYYNVIRFFNLSKIDSERKRVEIVYNAALVKRLLSRKAEEFEFTIPFNGATIWNRAQEWLSDYRKTIERDFNVTTTWREHLEVVEHSCCFFI